MTKNIASVRLISRKARLVELLGPKPLGSRRPTDIELRYQPAHEMQSRSIGLCFKAEDRRARFIVNEGRSGDHFLDYLDRRQPGVRLAAPYGNKGCIVEEVGTTDYRRLPISHSGFAGRVLSVGGKPVRR